MSAARRLERARWLLREIDSTGGAERAPADLLDAFHAEWRWAQRSRFVHRLLSSRLAAFGDPSPDATAERLRTAVGQELRALAPIAPWLRSFRSATPSETPIPSWMLDVAVPARLSKPVADALELLLRTAAQARAKLTAAWVRTILRVLEAARATARDDSRLSAAAAAAVASGALGEISESTTLARVRQLIDAGERAHAAGASSMALLDVLSLLHCLATARLGAEPGRIDQAAKHSAMAVLLDPYSQAARRNLEQVGVAAQQIRGQLEAQRWRLNEKGVAMLGAAENAAGRIQSLGRTASDHEVEGRRREAYERECAARLGMDADDEAHLTLVREIDAGIRELAAKGRATGPALEERLRHRPGAETLPWPLVAAALERAQARHGEDLTVLLPARAEPSASDLVRERVVAPLTGPPAASGLPRGWRGLFWLASTRDAAFKAAAAAGVLLAGYGVLSLATARSARAERDATYARALAARAAGDDGGVLEHGRAFLAGAGDRRDPRPDQVRAFLREASLREGVRRVEAGDDGGRRLLQDAEDLLGPSSAATGGGGS
jgi:hypothetical protein